jgi:nucleotide-binding universal stress UspA family protein
MFQSILLCTHGTQGARAAERLVFEQLAVVRPQTKIVVLTVIDQDLQNMTGDDRLNSSASNAPHLNQAQQQVGKVIEEEWERIRNSYPRSDTAKFHHPVGPLEETMAKAARVLGCDCIVIGPQRQSRRLLKLQMDQGQRSRLDNGKLHPLLPCPLLVAPALDERNERSWIPTQL